MKTKQKPKQKQIGIMSSCRVTTQRVIVMEGKKEKR